MKKRWMSVWVAVVVLSLPVAALAAPPGGQPVPNGRVLTRGPLEAEFAQIEAQVPGFGGWYFDAEGTAVVSLANPGRRDEALTRVAPFVEARRAAGAARYAVRAARYSFLQLAAFRRAVYENFPGGIVSVDVDEVRNVLALGVENANDAGPVRAFVAKLGIPANAVTVDVTGEVKARTTLGDRHRPLRGGSQIVFRDRYNQINACTLGINGVYYNDSSYAGFITASHCSQYPWSYAGNSAGQPTMGSSDLVANEYDDPTYFDAAWSGSCPVDTPLSGGWATVVGCRWSDTSFYRYLDTERSTAWGGATIHTTQSMNYAQPGSIVITGSLPVTGDASVASGTVIHKMGASSGWTYGLVSETCVDKLARSNSSDPFVLLLCQDKADLYVESGDSGAPVYKKFDTYTQWVGIFWGDDSQGSYYSPAWAVRYDLPNFSY